MARAVIRGYAAAADSLIPKYQRIDPARQLAPVANWLPVVPAKVLDIGAGTGEISAHLSKSGHEVLAVEPVASFRRAAMARHGTGAITWLDDRLPDLGRITSMAAGFDLILISALWHHLNGPERARSMARLDALLAPGATLIVSLRQGACPAERPGHAVPATELTDQAAMIGLRQVLQRRVASQQATNQEAGIMWDWLVFRRET